MKPTIIYLHNLLNFRSSARSLRSSGKNQLVFPNIFSSSGRRSFSYCAPFVWNNLPDAIRTAPSLLTFRALLKTHLFPPQSCCSSCLVFLDFEIGLVWTFSGWFEVCFCWQDGLVVIIAFDQLGRHRRSLPKAKLALNLN